MSTIASTRTAAPLSLLSKAARLTAAVVVAGFVALGWTSAGRVSHQAVDLSTAALSRNVIHVTLPAVEIVGRRDSVVIATEAASGTFDRTSRASAL